MRSKLIELLGAVAESFVFQAQCECCLGDSHGLGLATPFVRVLFKEKSSLDAKCLRVDVFPTHQRQDV